MSPFPQVFQFLIVAVAGWINQQQRDVIDYVCEASLSVGSRREASYARSTAIDRLQKAKEPCEEPRLSCC